MDQLKHKGICTCTGGLDQVLGEELQQQEMGYTTFSGPEGNYTLQYPSDWHVEYKKPVTRFDQPSTWFKLPDTVSIVSIELSGLDLTKKDFEDEFVKYYPLILRERFGSELEIENKTFGLYEINGSPAGSIVFTTPIDNTCRLSYMITRRFLSRIYHPVTISTRI